MGWTRSLGEPVASGFAWEKTRLFFFCPLPSSCIISTALPCACDQCLCSIMFPVSCEASAWWGDRPAPCYVSRPRWTCVPLIKCNIFSSHYAPSMCELSHRRRSGNRSPFPLCGTPPWTARNALVSDKKGPVVLWALRGHTYSSVASVRMGCIMYAACSDREEKSGTPLPTIHKQRKRCVYLKINRQSDPQRLAFIHKHL